MKREKKKELLKQIGNAEKELKAMREELSEPEFKKYDVVDARDRDSDEWEGPFFFKEVESDYSYKVMDEICWNQCRHAKAVPNVRLKHDGGEDRPEGVDVDTRITAWYGNGAIKKSPASSLSATWGDVIYYMIHDE